MTEREPTELERAVAGAIELAIVATCELEDSDEISLAIARAAIAECFKWRPIDPALLSGQPFLVYSRQGKTAVVAMKVPDFDEPDVLRWMVVDEDEEVPCEPPEIAVGPHYYMPIPPLPPDEP